jgi:hypothetical protein
MNTPKVYECPGCLSNDVEGMVSLCKQCKADLYLGQLVRKMPTYRALLRNPANWIIQGKQGEELYWGKTPEEILKIVTGAD